jgi:hypothetical protein
MLARFLLMELSDEDRGTLSCDISVRPRDAAGIAELLPYVRDLQTDTESVNVCFDLSGQKNVESFVAAERLCCTELIWTLEQQEHILHLQIEGTPAQLQVIEGWFKTGSE